MGNQHDAKPSGWWFPARTTAFFLVVAACSLAALSALGLGQIKSLNEENSAIRIERAGRTAAAIVEGRFTDATVVANSDGSPQSLMFPMTEELEPDPAWDELLDNIGNINQGAANLFRFNADTQAFDRLSTTFRTPEGARVGGSQIEPSLIVEGHPAYASLLEGSPYIGEVPVAGRLRLAYLTPVIDSDGSLCGLLAVDVGWVDDLNRINGEAADSALVFALVTLAAVAIVCVVVMFLSFRPLHRLTEIAHALGTGDGDRSVELTDRRDEIGYLAKGLAKVADLQQTLQHQAYNDALTEIPNRAALVQELERRFDDLTTTDPQTGAFALLIVDLDGFKEVNDGLGHQAGDELLGALAKTLHDALEPGEYLARLGGDEFALLSRLDPDIENTFHDIAQRAADSASGVFRTSAGDARVTASIGIALIPKHGATCHEAMSHADLALYEVKRSGRGTSLVYNPAFSESFERHLYLVAELRKALDAEALTVEYQPLYDTAGNVASLEGLARWTDTTGTSISPAEFIPIAESVGLIEQLGGWVLEEGCRQISEWAQHHDSVPSVSINVSTLQLRSPNFVQSVEALLERHPAARGRLCLELTESVLVQRESDWHRKVLESLSNMGVRLAIDDFGTGYSSLNYLHKLVVDQLKIDRTFVISACEDPKQTKLLAGIVGLGKGLGLSVVLEGIETPDELKLAQDLGCDLVQGFLLGRPMPPEQVAQRFGVTHPEFTSEQLAA